MKAFILAVAFALAGCAQLTSQTGTSTYIITNEQYERIQRELEVADCLQGETALALVMELPTGGATLIVRCQ